LSQSFVHYGNQSDMNLAVTYYNLLSEEKQDFI